MKDTTYKLSDEAIAHVAKLLQVAIITGTDIVDNLRLLCLVDTGDGLLKIDQEHEENFEKSISEMIDTASKKGPFNE